MTRNEAPELLEQPGASDQDEPSPPDRNMASAILSLPPLLTTQYTLPEAARQAILAQAPTPQPQPDAPMGEIERKRLEFIAMHGCPFGTLPAEDQ